MSEKVYTHEYEVLKADGLEQLSEKLNEQIALGFAVATVKVVRQQNADVYEALIKKTKEEK